MQHFYAHERARSGCFRSPDRDAAKHKTADARSARLSPSAGLSPGSFEREKNLHPLCLKAAFKPMEQNSPENERQGGLFRSADKNILLLFEVKKRNRRPSGAFYARVRKQTSEARATSRRLPCATQQNLVREVNED
jgi:hypothetical protein